MGDIGNVETSSSDGSSHEDGRSTRPESVEGSLSFSLSSVSVDRGGVVSLGAKEVAEHVGHSLGLDKDQDQTSGLFGE